MPPDPLDGLSAFLAVADLHSFTAAAARLGMSASAVSQTIRQLEQRLGLRLLNRTTRSVALTEAGAAFLARVRPAMDDLREAVDDLSGLLGRPAGTLRLNLSRPAANAVLEPVLAEFLASHPDIRLEVRVDDGLADIVADGFDAGIRLGESLDKDMVAVRLGGNLHSMVVAAPAYLVQAGRPHHPRDLLRHACINYRLTSSGALYRWEFERDGETLSLAVNGPLVVNDKALLLQAARAGVGLAYVIAESVAPLLADGSLVPVLTDWCPQFPGYYLYHPSRSQMPDKLRALIDFLVARRDRFTAPDLARRPPAVHNVSPALPGANG